MTPTEDKQNRTSSVQPQKLTLTPNSSLIEPYEPQLILPPSPTLVRPTLSPQKKVLIKPQNLIPKPKINPCDFHQHRARVKPFIKQENSINGSRSVYTVRKRRDELLILFANGQWMSPWITAVTHEGRYFHHLLFLNFSNMLVETELDIYQEYVPTSISTNIIITEWKKNISQHFEYLPQVYFQSSKYRKFKSHNPIDISTGVYWGKMRSKNILLQTAETITLPNLLLHSEMSMGMSFNRVNPFYSLNEPSRLSDFHPKCLW